MKIPISSRLAVLAALALGMIPLSSNAQVIFGPDTNMTTSNWTYGNTSASSGINIDVAPALSNVTDPDLGAALGMSTQVDFLGTNNKNIAGTIFNSSWTYNPSVSGAITSFSLTGDFTATFTMALQPVHCFCVRQPWKSKAQEDSRTPKGCLRHAISGPPALRFQKLAQAPLSAL